MITVLTDDSVPTRLPHFHLKEGSLYFLISRRPYAPLDKEQQTVWNLLDGVSCVGDLRARQGPSFDAIVKGFVERGVCTVVPGRFPANRKRVMVIEPHMDDAAFSVGGAMWLRRNECEFTIVTVASISCFTSYFSLNREFFNIETVSELRKAESAVAARLIGGRHVGLEQVEGSLRYRHAQWTLDWFQQHAESIHAFRTHSPPERELGQWTSVIAEAISRLQPEEVWMPLGVGYHIDHQLARHACINIISSGADFLKGREIKFFQDVPYAAMYPNHTADIVAALREAGARLEEDRVDIRDAMPHKLHLLSFFASQFKLSVVQRLVESSATLAGTRPGDLRELSYRVAAPPKARVDFISCYVERNVVYQIAARLERWFHRNRLAPSIVIIMAVPVGRWAEDMQFLLDTFPRAVFEVRMPRKNLAEAETLTSPRIAIHPINNRWRSWFAEAARAAVSRAKPLVVIPGRGREKYAHLIRILGIASDSVVAPTMNDFTLALRLVASKENDR
jgi:LmbE family N-acetylglucosaminyl deacetylase